MTRPRLSRREQLLALFTAPLILIAGIYLLGIQPLSQRRDLLRHDLAQTEMLLARYEGLLLRRQELVTKYRDLGKAAVLRQTYKSAVDLLGDIQRLASGLVDLTTMRPFTTDDSAGSRLGVEFDCHGELANVVRLLYRLEEEGGTMSIVTLTLSGMAPAPQVRAHLSVCSARQPGD